MVAVDQLHVIGLRRVVVRVIAGSTKASKTSATGLRMLSGIVRLLELVDVELLHLEQGLMTLSDLS